MIPRGLIEGFSQFFPPSLLSRFSSHGIFPVFFSMILGPAQGFVVRVLGTNPEPSKVGTSTSLRVSDQIFSHSPSSSMLEPSMHDDSRKLDTMMSAMWVYIVVCDEVFGENSTSMPRWILPEPALPDFF